MKLTRFAFAASAAALCAAFSLAISEAAGSSVPDPREASARIDQLVLAGLEKAGKESNAPIDDATFLRRAYLDIAGRIPTIEEAEAFHGSAYEAKRERLIEQLLGSEAFISHSFNWWADILRVNTGLGIGAGPAEAAYQLWLKQSLRDNMPYDQAVRELVATRGYIWDNGAAAYYIRDRGMPLDNMSNTVRIFLGTRLECAQCHNHPFDKWTQMDYFKMAAFSYGMDGNRYDSPNRDALAAHERQERERLYRETVGEDFPGYSSVRSIDRYLRDRRGAQWLEQSGLTEEEFRAKAAEGVAAYDSYNTATARARYATGQLYQQVRYFAVSERDRVLKLPHDYQYDDAKPNQAVEAGTMFGEEIDLDNIDDAAIEAYAAWMTSPDNPTFTRVIANRLWKRAFGHGLIEPVDDLSDHVTPSNPELMAYLEQLMKDLGYDTKAYLGILYNTEAYQRAAHAEELELGEPYHFAGPLLRRMTAEQIWDSIVALALPEADSYHPRVKDQLASVERLRRMYEALEGRGAEDYIAMIYELGEALDGIVPRQAELRQAIYKAREEKDDAKARQAREDLSKLDREARRIIAEIGFRGAGERVDGGQLLAAMGMSEVAMAEMNAGEGPENAVVTALPKPKIPDPPAGLDRDQRCRWQDAQNADLRAYNSLVAGMARASELPSPAPRGHFLREFGQSDREVIENASQEASVPQALNLMNGTISQALTNRFAVFGSRLHEAGDPAEKTSMIFQAMLTRQPSEAELEIALEEIERDGDKAFEGIVWALLNTRQFAFIQ